MNIFRVLFLGENDVYVNNTLYSYPSIFLEGQNRQQDFWCLYILMFYSKRYRKFLRTNSYDHLAVNEDEVVDILYNTFAESIISANEVRETIKRIIAKMIGYKILKKDDFPREKESYHKQYYISPMGNTIFEEFLKSNILFSIFRDELALDQERYNVKCSCDLSQEELYEEFLKYIEEFWETEKEYFININSDPIKRDYYREYFGEAIISQRMLHALEDSIHTYYRNDITGNFRVKRMLESIDNLKRDISKEIRL